MGRLDGRVALVTGAAQGIGAAFAKGLAEEGAKIAIADLDSGQTVVDIIKQAGGEAIDVPTDVSDEAAAKAAIAQTVEAFGRFDILVNNAAIFTQVERKKFDDISVDEWDKVCSVNIRGVWLMCKARGARDAQEQLRQDHQHFVGPRLQGLDTLFALRRLQGGGGGHHKIAGARTGGRQYLRQRHRARLDGERKRDETLHRSRLFHGRDGQHPGR